MPTVRQIEEALYALAPRELAEDWDIVGLLVGDPDREVSRILVSLDITQAVADEAAAGGAELIVAHHPVMNCRWHPVQSLREDTVQGKLLRTLIRGDIAAICMHTNLDMTVGGVNDVLAWALKLEDPGPLENGFVRTGNLPDGPISLQEFVRRITSALNCRGLRYIDGGRPVHRVAVGGGSCGEFRADAIRDGCDTFVTADIKYHDFLDAAADGINLIDAGHFETEDPVCFAVMEYLQKTFPELIIQKSSHQGVIQYYTEGE